MGFAQAATAEDGDKDEGGELIFFPGQLDRTLNIDESEVSTDGWYKLTLNCDSCPITYSYYLLLFS